jgi:hypothetical protein
VHTNEAGHKEGVFMRTVILWYPWAIQGLMNWLRHADNHKYPPEVKRTLERSLGHVLIADSADMLSNLSRAPVYVVAETYYGIGRIP